MTWNLRNRQEEEKEQKEGRPPASLFHAGTHDDDGADHTHSALLLLMTPIAAARLSTAS
jgi:hypothetical protein